MTNPRPSVSRFNIALSAVLAALLAPCLVTDARAADWQSPGVYAHESKDWTANVGREFPLVVVRFYTGQPVETQVAAVRKLVGSGNRVLVLFEFMQNIQQRRSQKPMPPIEPIKAKLLAMLKGLEGIPVEAISLDEENSLSGEKIKYLNALYRAAKQHSPDRRIVQWIVLRKKGGHIQLQSVDSIATDGWIIDPYLSSQKDYRAIVGGLKQTSKPIYSVIWAAPGWQVNAGYRIHAKPEWWNGSEWKIFYNRLAINQENDVSTIFYLYGLDEKKVKSLWTGNRCDRQFYSDLVGITLPHYKSNKLSSVTPATRPKWIPSYCG